MTKKDRKTCLNNKKDDFNQQIACKAPVRWTKYATGGCGGGGLNDTNWQDHIKALLWRPRHYCGRDVLIRKLQKFTIQNVSLYGRNR